ncbi:hypothetical protein ACJX0J_022179, partial [Zea mays]
MIIFMNPYLPTSSMWDQTILQLRSNPVRTVSGVTDRYLFNIILIIDVIVNFVVLLVRAHLIWSREFFPNWLYVSVFLFLALLGICCLVYLLYTFILASQNRKRFSENEEHYCCHALSHETLISVLCILDDIFQLIKYIQCVLPSCEFSTFSKFKVIKRLVPYSILAVPALQFEPKILAESDILMIWSLFITWAFDWFRCEDLIMHTCQQHANVDLFSVAYLFTTLFEEQETLWCMFSVGTDDESHGMFYTGPLTFSDQRNLLLYLFNLRTIEQIPHQHTHVFLFYILLACHAMFFYHILIVFSVVKTDVDSDTRIISFHTPFNGIVYYMTLYIIQSRANSDTMLQLTEPLVMGLKGSLICSILSKIEEVIIVLYLCVIRWHQKHDLATMAVWASKPLVAF